jgi:hypothetical protein
MTRKPYGKRRRYCDCGRIARYKYHVLLYQSDLKTEVHATLYLCETCFLLERELQASHSQKPVQATRLG